MSDHWKSLADLLGAPSLTPSKKPSEPVDEKAQPDPVIEPARVVEPPAAKVDEPVAAPAEPAKPKKRSSWEALANLFNIGNAPEPEVRPAPAAPVSPPTPPIAEAPTKQSEISIFKPAAPSQQNPALVDMFGETTSKPHESWGKPRRVVDDLGWDDEAPIAKRPEDAPVKPVRSLDETAEIDELESVEGEPVRRSRRRRRRGGRGRGEDLRGSDEALPEETTAEFRDSSWGKVIGEGIADADEDDVQVVGESDEEIAPADERRPRRRRRRRGRGRGPETVESLEPADDDVDSVNRHLLDAEDEDGPIEDLFESADETEPVEDAVVDPRRRRRRKRNRGGKRLEEVDSSREVDVTADDTDEDAGLIDADRGDDEAGGHRHRNIPTWEDSLAVLIEANIENHRRNEGRGGGPRGGGRNRGGRR